MKQKRWLIILSGIFLFLGFCLVLYLGLGSQTPPAQTSESELPQVPEEDYSTDDFADDFDDGNCDAWEIGDSVSMAVDNGSLYRAEISGGLGLATIGGDKRFKNFQAKVRQKLGSGTGWAGIHFRKDYPDDAPWATGYLVYLLDSKVTLYANVDGNPGILKEVEVSVPDAEWITLEVRITGENIGVWVNSTLVFDYQDDTYGSAGYFSLASFDREVRYDGVELKALDR